MNIFAPIYGGNAFIYVKRNIKTLFWAVAQAALAQICAHSTRTDASLEKMFNKQQMQTSVLKLKSKIHQIALGSMGFCVFYPQKPAWP